MTDLDGPAVVVVARAIATIAHRGQVDKAGQPYIDHPRRVAERVWDRYTFVPEDVAAAWLHDVLEDTDITRDDLRATGIPWKVIDVVELLTRQDGQQPEEYYELIRGNHSARIVKLADIADNTDPNRLVLLDDETIARLTRKYAKARQLLGDA